METKVKKTRQRHVLSGESYRRRTVREMTRIVTKIQSGEIGIRAASREHKICRPTLQKWISRLSVINLGDDLSSKLLSAMTDNKKNSGPGKPDRRTHQGVRIGNSKS